jgi:cytochrome P450
MDPTKFLDRATVDDPIDFYRALVAEAPVWPIPNTDVVVVSSYAAVTEATNRVAEFSSNLRNLLCRDASGLPAVLPFDVGDAGQALATADPPMHTRHRSALAPVFTARRMATLRDEVGAVAHPRVDAALAAGSCEFMDAVANAVPIRIVSRLIGFEQEDPDRLLAAAFDSTAMLAVAEPSDVILDAMARSSVVIDWLQAQLQRAVDHGADGILGALAEAIRTTEMTFDESLVIVATLLSAGGESTTGLMGNAVHLLATKPELQDRLRAEPELLDPFIEEALRLESPFRHHLRHVPKTTQLDGVEVPAGATMLLMWAAANRDLDEYERPDDVVLNRVAPRHHLAFGRGIHLCLGAPLARLETEVVLRHLLERTEQLELDADRPIERVNSIMVRRFERLPLILR